MKIRQLLKITSRTSSITNSFVQSIIPSIEPTQAEVDEALGILGMTESTLTCVYCGAKATDWDHLRPLVRKKKPTGYINEIRNLVPACAPCNQSKSGADWLPWMMGAARGSPKKKGVADIEQRIETLQRFESWGNVHPLRLKEMVQTEHWDTHWQNLASIEQEMKNAQEHAALLRDSIERSRKTTKS